MKVCHTTFHNYMFNFASKFYNTITFAEASESIDPLELALSETWENKVQITDLEDCDSETMSEEPLELTVPTRCVLPTK